MNLGRLLVFVGLGIAACGVLLILLERLNVPIGRLPGDVVWRGKNTTFYFPWVTCLLLSLIGSLILWFLNRKS